MLQEDFPVRIFSAFPSSLGLGLLWFEDIVHGTTPLDVSPIQFGHGQIFVQHHDEARNFRACNYTRECWIMFLDFPVARAVVAPFGRLLH